jgi:hypothetical protein
MCAIAQVIPPEQEETRLVVCLLFLLLPLTLVSASFQFPKAIKTSIFWPSSIVFKNNLTSPNENKKFFSQSFPHVVLATHTMNVMYGI